MADLINRMVCLYRHLELADESWGEIVHLAALDEDLFEYQSSEYLVLTDVEADTMAREAVLESVWAFKASFLQAHMPEGIDLEMIEHFQEKCESANPGILAMIQDKDHFVEDAIGADGRGHFLNQYDGEEYEETFEGQIFYIYRVN